MRDGFVLSTGRHSYRILKTIGDGGFGITYMAENLEDFYLDTVRKDVQVKKGRILAIKECFRAECMERRGDGTVTLKMGKEEEGAHMRKSFISEAQAMVDCQVNLPPNKRDNLKAGFVPVYHAGIYYGNEALTLEEELMHTGNGVYFYVMPYINGGTLDKQAGNLYPGSIELLLYRTLRSLEYLHTSAKINGRTPLHRDIKPSNIMLTDDGYPVLIDYGGMVMDVMSPVYAAPEQVKRERLQPATDLYSLGASFYELITKHRAPKAEIRLSAAQDPYRPLHEMKGLVRQFNALGEYEGYGDDWGWKFLMSIDVALVPELSERWESAKQWRNALFPSRPAWQDEQAFIAPISRTL